jgi:hypothetical protein
VRPDEPIAESINEKRLVGDVELGRVKVQRVESLSPGHPHLSREP